MLVDGDNAQPSLLENVLIEVAKYGTVTTRRVYGDWTTPQMGGWKASLQSHAVQPVQQFRYTTGKNSTDSALIIDAMDLLHSGAVGGFCIVSSDSDYTRLATRIREQGLFVMGIGRNSTPKSFVNACEVFVYTENLSTKAQSEVRDSKPAPADWTEAARRAVEMTTQDDGWARLGSAGTAMLKLNPAFDPRTYGHRQLSALFKSRPDMFETRQARTKDRTVSVRLKL